MMGGATRPDFVTKVYPAARREVGQWPTAESLTDAILRAISAAAESEPDPK